MIIKSKIIDLTTAKIMAIINVNEDSYYQNSRASTESQLLSLVQKHVQDGADIIDLGAVSTKPGADEKSNEFELENLVPAIKIIKKEFSNVIISIDTFRSEVALACLDLGADMINDVSAGEFDADMMKVVASFQVPFVLMHKQGSPATMQLNPNYDDVTLDIVKYFVKRIEVAKSHGIIDLILDPGFGFGKSITHNYQLLSQLKTFTILDYPLLVGVSRKSMIYKFLNITPENALSATSAVHILALQHGAKILRVHDVLEAKQCISLFEKMSNWN